MPHRSIRLVDNHGLLFSLCYLMSLFLSSFSFGSSATSVLLVIESPLPMATLRMRLKWASLESSRAIASNLLSTAFSAVYFCAHLRRCMIWRMRAQRSVSLMGQSLMVLSSTTALFMMSLPVSSEVYLLLSSLDWLTFGSMLLQTSPKEQQAPLQMSISTILELPIFMAILSGEVSLLGGLGEHFMALRTCLRILISPEQTAEWIMETWLKMLLTLMFILRSEKYSMSSMLPYRTAYMNGFQLLGVQNSLIRCGKVLKKFITCLVSPSSASTQQYRSSRRSCSRTGASSRASSQSPPPTAPPRTRTSARPRSPRSPETQLLLNSHPPAAFPPHGRFLDSDSDGNKMRYIYRSVRSFSLDHSNLKAAVTKSGARNFKIASSPLIEGYLTKNAASKPGMHTVVMIHEWWGFNESITQTAEIFSNSNIRVFVPDLYRGEAANNAEEAGHKMSSLNWPKALEDLSTVKNHFASDSQSVSVVGFCMGGALAFAALASAPGWKAGGVFYGIPDLNIFRLDKITANVIAHFGDQDPLKGFSDVESARKLKADCEKNHYPINVLIHEGASHAFCNQNSLYFNEKSRDTAFELTRQLVEN